MPTQRHTQIENLSLPQIHSCHEERETLDNKQYYQTIQYNKK
jgi:hypothetical protein